MRALLLCAWLVLAPAAHAAGDADAEIRAALSQWMADFNSRNASRICDLFARDLRYDYRGFPERDYDALCGLLRRSLADSTRTFEYALAVKEIIVSGDVAAVRLEWRLSATTPGSATPTVTREPGLDVFRKQSDGSWKIVRYIAYEEPQNRK
jgi:steroid delta-isomerase